MTAPNFAALERISALWNLLATHQELPAYSRMFHVADHDQIQFHVADAAAVDAYAEVLGLHHGGWLQSGDEWTYQRYDGYPGGRWLVTLNEWVAEPLPPQGAETAENSGPERAAVPS